MPPIFIVLIIIAAVLLIFVIPAFLSFLITNKIATVIFNTLFVKTEPSKWERACSEPTNEEHLYMFNQGLEWGDSNSAHRHEVQITSYDGLKLYGEFFDFGTDKCVIIVPGRAESLLYSYYFAPPFQKAGYSVLVIDLRAHGLSEGVYSCMGLKEYRDLLDWTRLLHDRFHIEHVVYNGICIGGAATVYACASEDCPDYVDAIITEGIYNNFSDVLKQRTRSRGKPTFPVVQEVIWKIKNHVGVDVVKDPPSKYIADVKVPMLFQNGKKDISTTPEMSDEIFTACGSSYKKRVWYDNGAHSHLRVQNLEKYDQDIIDFLQSVENHTYVDGQYDEEH